MATILNNPQNHANIVQIGQAVPEILPINAINAN